MRLRNGHSILLLILLFSFLILKNILPMTDFDFEDNCQEFAHIHHFNLMNTEEGFNKFCENDCHSGELASAAFTLPYLKIIFFKKYTFNFKIIYNIDKLIDDPDLLKIKKPPKLFS